MDDPAHLVKQRDDIARAVGLALSTWTIIETRLTQLFLIISTVQDNNKGYLMIDAIVSFDARLKIVTQLIGASGWPQLETKMWALLVEKIQKQQKRRNELAHFMIVNQSRGGPTEVVLIPFYSFGKAMRGETRPLRLRDLKEREMRFRELALAVAWFTDFTDTLTTQPPTTAPLEADLIRDIREKAALILAR